MVALDAHVVHVRGLETSGLELDAHAREAQVIVVQLVHARGLQVGEPQVPLDVQVLHAHGLIHKSHPSGSVSVSDAKPSISLSSSSGS